MSQLYIADWLNWSKGSHLCLFNSLLQMCKDHNTTSYQNDQFSHYYNYNMCHRGCYKRYPHFNSTFLNHIVNQAKVDFIRVSTITNTGFNVSTISTIVKDWVRCLDVFYFVILFVWCVSMSYARNFISMDPIAIILPSYHIIISGSITKEIIHNSS